MNYKINTKKRTVAVLGLGITGKSIIDYFKNSEIELICWDDDLIKRKQLINQKIRLHNLSDPEIWADIDTLLISPGIPYLYPKAHPAVINALENSVRIDNDIGLFFRNMINKNKKPLTICVTGSNGKSTTTSLINHILNSISNNSELGGNIGRPVLELNNNKSIKFNVLELSSYQIEIANFLSPDIAIFLNLSSDHLERHGGIGGYFNAKARLFYYGLPKFSIINIDQPEGRYLANILEKNSNMNTQVICLSSNKTNTNSKWSISLEDDFIVERKDGLETFRYNIHQYVNLPGEHNLMNSCIAFITCKLLQIDSTQILNNMINFKGLPHRAELVRKINEVSFINDSKATNMDSALKSIMTYDRIRWIVGGQKKDGDKVNIESQKKKIKKIYLIGSSSFELSKSFDGMDYSMCINLDNAVERAFKDSEPGDTILFAPGCASFDQFENFEKRGEKFCELVNFL